MVSFFTEVKIFRFRSVSTMQAYCSHRGGEGLTELLLGRRRGRAEEEEEGAARKTTDQLIIESMTARDSQQ